MQGDTRTEKWHKMEFKRDFMDVLTKYGRLPSASIEQQLEKVVQLESEAAYWRKQAEQEKERDDACCAIF